MLSSLFFLSTYLDFPTCLYGVGDNLSKVDNHEKLVINADLGHEPGREGGDIGL